MKFGKQFEFHKIPEWYTEYLDYERLKNQIKEFNKNVKCKFEFNCHSIFFGSLAFIAESYTYRRKTTKAKRIVLPYFKAMCDTYGCV
jgi:SPX domain protein involved in polyphosphate accumulation